MKSDAERGKRRGLWANGFPKRKFIRWFHECTYISLVRNKCVTVYVVLCCVNADGLLRQNKKTKKNQVADRTQLWALWLIHTFCWLSNCKPPRLQLGSLIYAGLLAVVARNPSDTCVASLLLGDPNFPYRPICFSLLPLVAKKKMSSSAPSIMFDENWDAITGLNHRIIRIFFYVGDWQARLRDII